MLGSKDVMEAIQIIKYEKNRKETKEKQAKASPMHWTNSFGKGQNKDRINPSSRVAGAEGGLIDSFNQVQQG